MCIIKYPVQPCNLSTLRSENLFSFFILDSIQLNYCSHGINSGSETDGIVQMKALKGLRMIDDESSVYDFSLRELGLVDSPPEASFDNLTKLATELLDVPVSLVSIVDYANKRQYFKSQIGLTDHWAIDRQTPLSHSFCQYVVNSNAPLIVEDARKSELLKDNLAIPDLGVTAYMGTPFYGPSGIPIGALCAISGEPRVWSQSDKDKLNTLASCVTDLIRLRASLKTSEALRKEQQEFAAVLSHDMKSPTNTLKLLHSEITNALGSSMDKDVADLLHLCEGTTDRMSSLVEEVLEYMRATGVIRTFEAVDLNELMKEVIADHQDLLRNTDAKVSVRQLPTVNGNAVQLRVLLQNLVSNGIKFVEPGTSPELTLTALTGPEPHSVVISVKDNGIGIAYEHQDKIFKMFQRLHLREDYTGSGIGLSLCQRIVKNHRGSIEVKSSPGEGSEFLIKLPVTRYD